MKTRGIMFKAEMVRAILDGTKTQTRRLVKPQPFWVNLGDGRPNPAPPCPFGVVGDRLWVRETWQAHPSWALNKPSTIEPHQVVYRADFNTSHPSHGGAWRPAIFMPRWASRLELELGAVRVERLRDISDDDALAEGVVPKLGRLEGSDELIELRPLLAPWPLDGWGPRQSYASLFDSINGKGSWDANPWVWVLGFKRVP